MVIAKLQTWRYVDRSLNMLLHVSL